MSVIVAEYLGVRTDSDIPITPITINKSDDKFKPLLPCPFKDGHCSKAKRGDKPICSIRNTNTNELWISCEHRLCATSPKRSFITEHQASILHQVAKAIFNSKINKFDVLVKREVPIGVTGASTYKADLVMWRKNPEQTSPYNPDRAVILEMQGGGETTNTGDLTRHVEKWEQEGKIDNKLLTSSVSKVSPLVTNAWRRQQEQFLVKGNVAMQTGGRMVFCVGSMIYDYLLERFRDGVLSDLKDSNWTLAILTFTEDQNPSSMPSSTPHAIPLTLDHNKTIFTNYNSFIQVLTNQASPDPEIFLGEYFDLNSEKVIIK